jgi:hypothetical protein
VSPARLGRALPTSSRWCLLPLGYEGIQSLWTASSRLPFPYEGDALPDELQRRGFRGIAPGAKLVTLESNQEVLPGQSRAGLPIPLVTTDSDPHVEQCDADGHWRTPLRTW